MKNICECPFCGEKETSMSMSDIGKGYWMRCKFCKAEGSLGFDFEQATDLWNIRSSPWKTIGESQKNGKLFFLWWGYTDHQKYYWNKGFNCWVRKGDMAPIWPKINPTHYMNIPQNPE